VVILEKLKKGKMIVLNLRIRTLAHAIAQLKNVKCKATGTCHCSVKNCYSAKPITCAESGPEPVTEE
jgi:hypothetical protein